MPESLLNQGDTENQKADESTLEQQLFQDTANQQDDGKTADDQKGQDQKAEDQKAEGKKDGDTDAVPETYDLKVPEGFVVDDAVMGEFTELAKEAKLSRETAQKFADLHAKLVKETSQKFVAQWERTIETWQAEAKADPEIGGAGHEEKLATAKYGLKKFGTPELSQLMDDLYVGNHKEFIRLFYRLGKIAQDPKFVEAESVGSVKSDAEVLYPEHRK